jgi:mono/diheme cytochrome c family protein
MWRSRGRQPSVSAEYALAVLLLAGCTQEMANQPRIDPLEPSPLSGEIAPPRAPVAGTVARGQHWPDEQFLTGRVDGEFATALPPSLGEYFSEDELVLRGRQRFSIFCAHCHGLLGGGDGGDSAYRPQVGMVVLRGFPVPPTYHQPRLREASLGHFFEVITHGSGRMPAHGSMIPPEDRWAIAAYIQALQLSQYAPRGLLSPEDEEQLSQRRIEND